jgi:hypothetical protein
VYGSDDGDEKRLWVKHAGDEAPSVVDTGDAVTVMSEAEWVLKHVGEWRWSLLGAMTFDGHSQAASPASSSIQYMTTTG